MVTRSTSEPANRPRRVLLGQLAAWVAAMGITALGAQGIVAEWPMDLAMLEFGWLLLGPVVWLLTRGAPVAERPTESSPVRRVTPSVPPGTGTAVDRSEQRADWIAAACVFLVSLGLNAVTGSQMGDLPPAYHDEYSYLFQAQSIAEGRWTWPSPPAFPELFDQMHVLNEGRMASRYYPGTGTWLAPWVWAGHPVWGQWLAEALAAALVFGTGRELAGRIVGVIAGLTFACAPGLALFSNLLLAHAPTLLGLMTFLYAFVRGVRTGKTADFLLSGVGLAFAVLCRPATAAGFGLPFAIWCLAQTVLALRPTGRAISYVRPVWIGYGVPLLAAGGIAVAYNAAATGDWRTSPYQLYTDIYTPRHVYGLDNVKRGEQRLGPKVLDEYDRWAENLTPSMAHRNVRDRLLITGLWTIGLPLMVITAVWSLPLLWAADRRWMCVAWAIVSLHAIHWPYWYVGIMGWHYVLETAPLWCLLFGRTSVDLHRVWTATWHRGMTWWFAGLPLLAYAGMYLTFSEDWQSRWMKGVQSIHYPRQQHAEFRTWVEQHVGPGPALVLVDQTATNPHLDFVVNNAGLRDRILIGRYRPGKTSLADVTAAYPDRQVYVARPTEGRIVTAEEWLSMQPRSP